MTFELVEEKLFPVWEVSRSRGPEVTVVVPLWAQRGVRLGRRVHWPNQSRQKHNTDSLSVRLREYWERRRGKVRHLVLVNE